MTLSRFAALLVLPAALAGQRAAPTLDSARYASGPRELRGLRWRLVGPFRGGRAVAVTGDPTKRNVFYFGAVNGGIWKTTNGGASWANITDGKSNISSVGAIAVAPSDPNVIYAGGGEADFREDWTYGDGMYRSTDAGQTWQSLGLQDARHIARIVVDPRDPDRVIVAAMGHASGPSSMRGVYRSNDGGKSWQRVLFADDSTGAIDVALDPSNPRIMYAALWHLERTPWGFTAGGGRSGLWKSIDGGDTWKDISFNPGIPKNPLGRIGISVSPVNPQRVYATIESPPEDSTGGIFRSDDAGATWQRTSGDQRWMVRPFYYSVVTADPANENTMYVMNLGTWRSTDGGRTFTRLRLPHGDTHALWIDPKDPQRMISGNDGGATISFDGGEIWSSIMNQPTAQFYHVTTDDQWPYRIYGAQQDNTTLSIRSRSDDGVITADDWYPVGGGESGYIAPKPGNPNIVIAGTYTGTMTRYDVRTKQAKDISVWLNNYDGWAARDVPNRFQWTYPITYSKHDPTVLYTAASKLFRSTNDGDSWEAISPDLTLHDPKTLGPAGGPITYDMTGTEWYASIFAFAESPLNADVLWAGSDDGLVHVSRDRSKTWTNVTPPFPGKFTRVSIIEASRFDPGTAYLAANRYQLDDFKPYLFRTTDYGKSWRQITSGIPEGAYTRTIREDPVRRGLLYAGTETGVYFSTDDGARWMPLQLNLPRASVRDLHVHGADLIAATHGRAMWVLDDVTPLRQMTDSVRGASVHLFVPDTAVRFAGGWARTSSAGENPPAGVVVNYWLKSALSPNDTAKLEFLDASGKVVRHFSSAPAPDSVKSAAFTRELAGDSPAAAGKPTSKSPGKTPADTLSSKPRGMRDVQDDTLAFIPSDSIVTVRAGLNRFVWDLRYPDTREVKDVINDEGSTRGPFVAPGNYTARITAGGRTLSRPFVVRGDPRLTTTQADYDRQLVLALQVQTKTNELSDAVQRILDVEHALDERTTAAKGQAYAKRVTDAAKPLRTRLEAIRDSLVEIHSHADQITLHYPVRYYNMLLSLAGMVQSADAAPTAQEGAIYRDIAPKVDQNIGRLRAIESNELAAFNALLKELNVPGVPVSAPAVVP
ncbi:MAG: repeat-containing glycosyl hydrolase [Gemmatimonadetes bacterium]|nr:repeat-containing glycosyl hydrolase [Gemmatimonadota bacterium]